MKGRKLAVMFLVLGACSRMENVGKTPDLSPTRQSAEHSAMVFSQFPDAAKRTDRFLAASLWSREQTSLLGDRRASKRGDIMTVVIEIDDKAEISNSSGRSRSSSNGMQVPQLLGIPQRLDENAPEGASMANAVSTNAQSSSAGEGSVSRNEKLTLKIAATVIDVLPNGALSIEGSQEVRVNYELRELLVTGFVRPADISRQNEITYDKIASARISYGGRGQISDVQQPRIGQQVLDIILPF